MMEYSVLLEASDPARNRWRSYHIAAGQDLFGDWVVELTYGRIGVGYETVSVRGEWTDIEERFTC
jgi:hypothetical protein